MHIEAGDKQTAVTDHHLVHTASGVVPARLVRAGTVLLPNDTVTRVQREGSDAVVSLIYTASGRFVADGRGESGLSRPRGAAGANFFGGAVWGNFRENAYCGDPPG